jgi:hypothetical protein
MKLLVISYFFPPDTNARALRWGRLVDEWRKSGHEVVVVTRRQHGLPRTADFHGAKIHRVGGALGDLLRRALGVRNAATSSSSVGGPKAPAKRSSFMMRAVRAAHSATWRRVYWPDHAAAWISPAERAAAALLREEPFDALVSVSHPFSGHVVGLHLKQQFPTLPWLADSGDPFSFFEEIPLNNVSLYSARNRRVEGQVVEMADILTVTVESCRAAYAAAFPAGKTKTVVIPPLVTSGGIARSASPASPHNLVYVGTLYQRIRNPAYLMALLGAVPELTLDVYGDINDCADQFDALPADIATRVTLHGTVPATVAGEAMARAGTLVNIGNSTKYQLPSKVFEYIATGRPILNLVGGDWDTSLPFLKRYPSNLNLTMFPAGPSAEDVAGLRHWLDRVTNVQDASIEHLLAGNRSPAVAKAYIDLISGTEK